MTGKNRRHYHCKALNSLLCADVPLRNYSLTHSVTSDCKGVEISLVSLDVLWFKTFMFHTIVHQGF